VAVDQPDSLSSLKSYAATVGRSLLYFSALVLASAMVAGMNYAVVRLTGQGLPAQPVPAIPPPHTSPDADTAPVTYEGCRYHADDDDAEAVESNGRPWPVKKITYHLDLSGAKTLNPRLSDDAIRGAFRQAWGWWSEGLDIEPVEVSAPAGALVRIRFAKMDGPLGTLAESNLADGTTRPKQQTYDSSEKWTAGGPAANLLSLPTVACHEIGHVLGLGHDDPTAAAVLRPVYTSQIPRETARDLARAVALGYKRRAASVPAPEPAGATIQVPVTLKADDLLDPLRKLGWTVQPK
jgi:hypothetical protein